VFRIFGHEPDGDAVANDAFSAAVPPDDREQIELAVRAALDGGRPYDLDHRVVRPDGTVRIVRARSELERDPATGRAIRMFGTVHDVTEARLAEDRLRASEERLRLALSAGRVVVWESDFRDDRLSLSDNAIEVMGIRADQLVWSRTAFTDRIHPDDLAEVRELSTRVMVEGTGSDFSYRFLRPDNGAAIWLEGRSQMTRDRDGAIIGARGVLVDVTARRAAEELRQHSVELEARNRRIEEASRLKSEFLANMSHELRTPLNAILGFAELLHDGVVDPTSPQHREFLGDILNSGQHLLQLINDVLDLAKVEAGRLELRPEPIDLPALVAEVCSILRTTAASRRITVEHQLDPGLIDLVLDPSRLKQVLYNYLSNALKFTHEGGRVTIRATAESDDRLRLEVEDDGIGIAPADLNRLFLDFQQLDGGSSKRHAGTGLGLALTRRLVEAQGGEVGVRSQPGLGSVFHAILPRHAVAGTPRLRPRRESSAGIGP
jgi:PAS domain S-box-containing protein